MEALGWVLFGLGMVVGWIGAFQPAWAPRRRGLGLALVAIGGFVLVAPGTVIIVTH